MVGYKTNYYNKLLAFSKNEFVRNNFYGGASYSMRKGYFKRTTFSLGFNYTTIDDSIVTSKYNPQYFNSNSGKQFYTDIGFNVFYANTNKNAYAQSGLKYFYGIKLCEKFSICAPFVITVR